MSSSSKFVLNSSFFRTLIMSRRGYAAVAAENVKVVQTAAAVRKNKAQSGATVFGEKEENQVFWMRDPKTGYWVPETHFHDVDVVELREKLLSKNCNNKP